MNRFALIAGGVLVLAACSHQSEAATETPSPASAVPTVTFFAEGDGTKAGAVTFLTETGGTIQKDVALPMTDTTKGTPGISSDKFQHGATLYMSLQNMGDAGSVTCRIEATVDGKVTVVDTATSSGGHVIASCTGKVP